jgi:pyruvate/2-oxoglutarate dehydrogenase complex dihydrolipoamide acyltransferase (E2) component
LKLQDASFYQLNKFIRFKLVKKQQSFRKESNSKRNEGVRHMVEFKLPDLGEGMHEGEIIQWMIKEGDFITQDQPVVEIQTDKFNAELTAPVTGEVKKIFFSEGDVVEVGTTIFTIQAESVMADIETTAADQETAVTVEK